MVGRVGDPFGPLGTGQTPLDPDESDGLLPSWVRTREDLNLAESDNIVAARTRVRARSTDDVLDDSWLRRLHRAMFGDVWRWAGTYRTTERNIGIDPVQIAVAVRDLVADARAWIAHDGVGNLDQPLEDRRLAALTIAARFHHRLVAIHPFPNGNGRHARFATDLLVEAMGLGIELSWGAGLGDPPTARRRYLDALRAADRDRDDLAPLVDLMCS